MHLSHRAACTDEDCRAACAQFTTVARFTIRGGNVCAICADEGDVIVMQAAEVHLDESIERFCANEIACAATCNQTRDLTNRAGGCWVQHYYVIEAGAVGKFFVE